MTALVNPGLAAELARSDEFNADACMNCGVCSAICPMGVDVQPRKLFRYVLLGMEDQVHGRDGERLLLPALQDVRGELPRGRAHRRERAHPAPPHRPHRLRPRGGMTMPLPTGDVIGILADNLRLRKSVLPLSDQGGDQVDRGSRPAARRRDRALHRDDVPAHPVHRGPREGRDQVSATRGSPSYTGLGRRVNRVVNVSAFMARPSAEERAVYDQVPINVVHLLRKAGVEFGALYEDDLYSGALAYDLGARRGRGRARAARSTRSSRSTASRP